LVYSYIGIRVTRIGGFLIRVNWNLGLLDGCRTARVRLVREIAERETGVARDGFRDSSRVLRRRHHLRREVLRQLRDAGERECVEEFEGRDVVQPDHASRFSEEPHSSRDGHQRILVVDKWTLQHKFSPRDASSRSSVFLEIHIAIVMSTGTTVLLCFL
jgi:hypothetical protein